MPISTTVSGTPLRSKRFQCEISLGRASSATSRLGFDSKKISKVLLPHSSSPHLPRSLSFIRSSQSSSWSLRGGEFLSSFSSPSQMSLERVQVHVKRFGKFISVLSKLFGFVVLSFLSQTLILHYYRRYRSLMDWENPPFTFTIFGHSSPLLCALFQCSSNFCVSHSLS